MHNVQADRPTRSFLLIDDDQYSATFFSNQLEKCAGCEVAVLINWVSSAQSGQVALEGLTRCVDRTQIPDVVVVDLKASSSANLNFVQQVSTRVKNTGVKLAVFVTPGSVDAEKMHAFATAGASAVFERHANLDAFRTELSSLLQLSQGNSHAA